MILRKYHDAAFERQPVDRTRLIAGINRYFLHLIEPGQNLADPAGTMFGSLPDAWNEAIAAIRDMIAAEIREDGHCRLANRSIAIADEDDRVLEVVKFVIARGNRDSQRHYAVVVAFGLAHPQHFDGEL